MPPFNPLFLSFRYSGYTTASHKVMLNQQLRQIRGLLRRREIKLSDALLIVLRYLRNRVPPERLIWLNRELLGYTKEDLPTLYEKPKGRQFNPFKTVPRHIVLEVPEYRFLHGAWGKLDDEGQLITVEVPKQLGESCIFCNMGIQQIETVLDDIDSPDSHMFSMSADPQTGTEYYCWSTELVRVHDAVRLKLCQFIENMMEEPKLPSNER
jgi:hypothetical protein